MSNDNNDEATIEVRRTGQNEWTVTDTEGVDAEVLYTVTDGDQNSEMKLALGPDE